MSSKDQRLIRQLQSQINELNKRAPSIEEMNNKIKELEEKEIQLQKTIDVLNSIPLEKVKAIQEYLELKRKENNKEMDKGLLNISDLYLNYRR